MGKLEEIFDAEDVRLLADIGFLAAFQLRGGDVEGIFNAVRALRPAQEAGYIGGAIVHIFNGDPGAAILLLEQGPLTPAAAVFLGVALAQRGDLEKGAAMLLEVLQVAPDTPFSSLAQDVLASLPQRRPALAVDAAPVDEDPSVSGRTLH